MAHNKSRFATLQQSHVKSLDLIRVIPERDIYIYIYIYIYHIIYIYIYIYIIYIYIERERERDYIDILIY